MSYIVELRKSFLSNKYKYLLKYNCYNNSTKLCNKLSYKKNGYCNECDDCNNNNLFDADKQLEKYNINEHFIVSAMKNFLNECDTFVNKSNDESKKDYRIKRIINIYEYLYYNFFLLIIHPKLCITTIQKIFEFMLEQNYIQHYVETNNYKHYIYSFFVDIYSFLNKYKEKNNIIYDMDIKKEDYDKFLDNLMEYIQNYYDKIIDLTTIKDNSIEIDINDISNIEIILSL